MVDRIIRGDSVRHSELLEHGVGRASFMIDGQRSVIWDTGGHWGAGGYDPATLIRLKSPEPAQLRLPIKSS